MIEVVDLYKSFGDNHVLEGMNLQIDEGKTVVVVGRSGCGKSVFLKIVIGLLKSDGGSVLVNDRDITKISYKELMGIRKMFGMVFQGSALFDSLTVDQNIGLGLRKHSGLPENEIKGRIYHCLEMVGLEGTENLYSAELSGGMKKRVGFARALAMDPKFVLYDEPTTGLDPVTARSIDKLMVRMHDVMSVTAIVVTHDMQSAFYVGDKIAMLHDGGVRFVGTPEEIDRAEDPIVHQFVKGLAEEELPLSGVIKEPLISASPSPLYFGHVSEDEHLDKSLTIDNTGSAPLKITRVHIASAGEEFRLLSLPKLPLSVEPSSRVDVTIRFAPKLEDKQLETLCIESNAVNSPMLDVSLVSA